MPNKFFIYRNGDNFIFEIVDSKGKHHVCRSVRIYTIIINNFIENGYNITKEDNKKIVLTAKGKDGKDIGTITIQVDERLWSCKYLKALKEDIIKTRESIRLNKLDSIEKQKNQFANLVVKTFQSHAAIGVTITLISAIIFTSLIMSKVHLNGKTKDTNYNEEYALSIAPKNNMNLLMDSDAFDPLMYLNTPENQTYFFDRSLLLNSLLKEDSDNNATIYEPYLKTYAKYFHLDDEKVIEFAKTITKNYTIPFQEINGTNAYVIDNKEAACLVFIYNLSRNALAVPLENYGYTYNYFVKDYYITTLPADKILSNGETFEKFFGKVCDLLGIDKYWTLGITYLESGHVSSYLALTQNNFGGLRGKNGFYTYISPEAGIIAHCSNIKRYESMGLNNIYELAGKYVFGNSNLIYECNANPDDVNLKQYKESLSTWVNSVTAFHNTFLSRTDELF